MNNIVLIGMMGTGKTSVALALKKHLSFDIIDTDHAIEKAENKSISNLFELEGEAAFRQKESEVCKSLTGIKHHIISTGGGIVTTPENHAPLKSLGLVVWLKASLKTLILRLNEDTTRPLLKHTDWKITLESLNTTRENLYADMCDLSVDTDSKKPEDIAQIIVNEYTKHYDY